MCFLLTLFGFHVLEIQKEYTDDVIRMMLTAAEPSLVLIAADLSSSCECRTPGVVVMKWTADESLLSSVDNASLLVTVSAMSLLIWPAAVVSLLLSTAAVVS